MIVVADYALRIEEMKFDTIFKKLEADYWYVQI